MAERRAVGVIRVSRQGKREDNRFASPDEQRKRIEQLAQSENLRLVDVLPEIDVSGGSPLEKRPGLRSAVELVEAGKADVVVVAYFDRLVRSLRVQEEVVRRVEFAGGRILAADIGGVTAATASQWLSSTMLGMVAEYTRRAAGERTAEALRSAIESGKPPHRLIPGYRRLPDGTIEPDGNAAIVVEAFEMRARGATLQEVRMYLRRHGIERSIGGTRNLLQSKIPIGELEHGSGWSGAVPAILDRDLWERVQTSNAPRGRYAKSERLLARLGILKCRTCGSRMVVNADRRRGKVWWSYRCPGKTRDCARPARISAEVVEREVMAEVDRLAAYICERVPGSADAERWRAIADRDQKRLEATIKAFDGLEDEPEAVQKIRRLREARDASRAEAERAAEREDAIVVSLKRRDAMCIGEQRRLVRALIDHVLVTPGRGGDRLLVVSTVTALEQAFADIAQDTADLLLDRLG